VLTGFDRTRGYLLGGGAEAAGDALEEFSSIVKAQCASTFLPPDFALMKTVQVLSRNLCVT
jgi:hypothetical protein